MTIQRFETGPRMSQVVVHGNTVYLAGDDAREIDGVAVDDDLAHARSGFEALDGHFFLLIRGGGFLARRLAIGYSVLFREAS